VLIIKNSCIFASIIKGVFYGKMLRNHESYATDGDTFLSGADGTNPAGGIPAFAR
jgi:hypothetical protein